MTSARSISSFINWAEQKIATEYEKNERLRKEHGDIEEPIKTSKHIGRLTERERHDLIREIDYFIKNGYHTKDACHECGVHTTTYHRWKRNIKNGIPTGTASNQN